MVLIFLTERHRQMTVIYINYIPSLSVFCENVSQECLLMESISNKKYSKAFICGCINHVVYYSWQ